MINGHKASTKGLTKVQGFHPLDFHSCPSLVILANNANRRFHQKSRQLCDFLVPENVKSHQVLSARLQIYVSDVLKCVQARHHSYFALGKEQIHTSFTRSGLAKNTSGLLDKDGMFRAWKASSNALSANSVGGGGKGGSICLQWCT